MRMDKPPHLKEGAPTPTSSGHGRVRNQNCWHLLPLMRKGDNPISCLYAYHITGKSSKKWLL
jgi:hypothetical protein